MRRTFHAFVGSAALVLGGGAGGVAQEAEPVRQEARGRATEAGEAPGTDPGRPRSAGPAYRVSGLMNMDVVNQAGEDIGDVADIVLDGRSGRVRYVAMSVGGVLGIGDKLFAVPWRAFRVQQQEDDTNLVINADRRQFEDAPGFDKDNWPNFADEKWVMANEQYYSDEGVTRTRPGRRGGADDQQPAEDPQEP